MFSDSFEEGGYQLEIRSSFLDVIEIVMLQKSEIHNDHGKNEYIWFLFLVVKKVLIFKAVHDLRG